MSPLTYLKLGGMAALLVGTALVADSNGANRVIARQAKQLDRLNASMKLAQSRLNMAQDRIAAAEGQRITTVREIYREVPTLIDRPVYRVICGDDDGVRLLDRAAAAANRVGRPEPAAPAGGRPSGPADG